MPFESNFSYISKVLKSYFYCSYFLDILVTSFISFSTQKMGQKEGFLVDLEVWGFVSRSPLLLGPEYLVEVVVSLLQKTHIKLLSFNCNGVVGADSAGPLALPCPSHHSDLHLFTLASSSAPGGVLQSSITVLSLCFLPHFLVFFSFICCSDSFYLVNKCCDNCALAVYHTLCVSKQPFHGKRSKAQLQPVWTVNGTHWLL